MKLYPEAPRTGAARLQARKARKVPVAGDWCSRTLFLFCVASFTPGTITHSHSYSALFTPWSTATIYHIWLGAGMQVYVYVYYVASTYLHYFTLEMPTCFEERLSPLFSYECVSIWRDAVEKAAL